MKSLLLFACLVAASYGQLQKGWGQDSSFGPANCQCTCDCTNDPIPPCKVDYFVLLDAASCVRDAWDEMKLRVDLIARQVDAKHKLGEHSRFSVIRYAKEAHYDIAIEQNLKYADFSRELDGLETFNEGSFLSQGLKMMVEKVRQNQGHKQVVIIITNGNSHPENPKPVEESKTVRNLNSLVNGELYINTIIPIVKNEFEVAGEHCIACAWNKKVFVEMGGLDINKQIVSKDKLQVRMKEVVKRLCYVQKPTTECTVWKYGQN